MNKVVITLTRDQALHIADLLLKRDVSREQDAFNWRVVMKINKSLLKAKSQLNS